MKFRIALSCLLVAAALSPSAHAAPSSGPAKPAAGQKTPETSVHDAIRADLAGRQSTHFGQLLTRWKKKYGSKAVAPLVRIASDRKATDMDRYIAIMGAGQLGGQAVAPVLSRFLTDSSWMIRSGTLRALAALGNASVGSKVLPLLKDPALVVRHEAVATIEKLKPAGAVDALLAAVKDQANYHGGKAQWVPQRALNALASLNAPKGVARELLPLLDRSKDPSLVAQTVRTLSAVTGHPLSTSGSLDEQVRSIKRMMAAERQRMPAGAASSSDNG